MPRKIILATIIVLLIGISTASIRIQEARAATTVNKTLYASASSYGYNNPYGWGFSNTSITSPGPTITINQYDYLNLTLISYDSVLHQFFVDYNNNSALDTGSEPASTPFTATTVFGFNATTSGNFTYRCSVHPTTLYGTLVVQQAVPEFSPFLILPLFILATTVAAVAYRTKRSAKKMPNIP
ncbi:MAG: hypothetical protein ABSD73_03525 [Candidatus Bathyarchaeia archaeon]|jgi:plastocyanin